MPLTDTIIEAGVATTTLLALVLYFWRLSSRTKAHPSSTAMGRHRLAREKWLKAVHRNPEPVFVVQMLRNWITVATFLASMAILFAVGLLSAAFTTEKLSQFAHGLNFLGSQGQEIWLLKALVLIAVYLAAFFCFSLTTRALIHAGFAITAQLDGPGEPNAEIEAHDLEQGARYYTLGMRCLYISMPLALWLFGPLWMLAGTIVLLAVLHYVD